MKFPHLFAPMQVGKVTYRNRIVSAPMAFGLIVQNPAARDFTYRKLESGAKGGNACVIVGETHGAAGGLWPEPGAPQQPHHGGYLVSGWIIAVMKTGV